jgi:hypothetical protein
VVTPNKKWGAGPLARHAAALAAAREGRARLLAEASVGAGLPVLSTLRDLVDTGDRITRIEARPAFLGSFALRALHCASALRFLGLSWGFD